MTNYISNGLWKDIEDFEIGLSEASLTFTDRLARENGWELRYAGRVVDEYRRFCFLAMTTGHPVTPSEEVDQAWHLHLLYTENYWTGFCGEVLERPLHHGPTRGGAREGGKFHDWYRATLDSYERVFGEAPPSDIWPDAQARFQDAHRFRRINTASHWVIPKPDRRSLRLWLMPALALPVLGACAITSNGRTSTLVLITGIITLLLLIGIVSEWLVPHRRYRRPRRTKRSGRDNTGAGGGGGGAAGCGNSGCGGGGCGGGCGG